MQTSAISPRCCVLSPREATVEINFLYFSFRVGDNFRNIIYSFFICITVYNSFISASKNIKAVKHELPIAAQQYQPYQPSTVLVHARWSWYTLLSLKITLPSLVERDYIYRTQAFATREKKKEGKEERERGEGKKKETLRFWILFITDKLCKTIMAYQIMKVTGNTSFNHKGTFSLRGGPMLHWLLSLNSQIHFFSEKTWGCHF